MGGLDRPPNAQPTGAKPTPTPPAPAPATRARPPLGPGRAPLDIGAEDLVGDRAVVLGADPALPIDEEGLRHPVHPEVHRHLARRVLGVREREAEIADELLRRLAPVLDVHADHDPPALAVRA